MAEHLLLKWGALKGWEVESEACKAALDKYFEDPVSMSAAMQHCTAKQKEAICELIDVIDGPITNDWSGDKYTKEQAKKYIMEYNDDAR